MARDNKTWPEWLRTIQPSDFLYPENEYKFRVIPEGLMKSLMKSAETQLRLKPNCSGLERQHWEELAAGKPPYGLMIERRTNKGTVHVACIGSSANVQQKDVDSGVQTAVD